MISSPAKRAMQTAEALAEELGYPWDEIIVDERLYDADSDEILSVIQEQDDWLDHLMVVGHNPGLTALANYLSGVNLGDVPTCGIVAMRYDVSEWDEISPQGSVQVRVDYPKKVQR